MISQQGYLIVALIVSILCLVNGKHKFAEVVKPERFEEIHCDFASDHIKLVQSVKCAFRTILVKLNAEPGYSYHPDVVPLQRCQGHCFNGLSCMPTEKNLTSIIVQQQHVSANMFSCVKIHVEQHTKCSCHCDVNKCNPKQIYSEDDCACICVNLEEKQKCDRMPGRTWDPEKCKCRCNTPSEDCSTGFEWIPSICQCARINLEEDYMMENDVDYME